jgi:hypothetical protein
VIKAAQDYIDPAADLILDLGCGWGHRMFDLWRNGVGARAKFIGGDRSEHSRTLVETTQKLFPRMDVSWVRFDLLNPDFSAFPAAARNIGLVTSSAIEQVTYLGPRLFDALLARFPDAKITGVHIEPITFQFAQDYPPPPYVEPVRDRQAAERLRYNMDLYEQVKSRPQFEIKAVGQALLDLGRGNSFSLLAWQKAAGR